jgi:hypothetical protein
MRDRNKFQLGDVIIWLAVVGFLAIALLAPGR